MGLIPDYNTVVDYGEEMQMHRLIGKNVMMISNKSVDSFPRLQLSENLLVLFIYNSATKSFCVIKFMVQNT